MTVATIGILETGVPPAGLRDIHGSYPDMIAALLGRGVSTRTYDVRSSELPTAPDAHPAYVITGSSAGVYDDLPWIAPLAAFLQTARGRVKLVGICFGHQIMAQAFGGAVRKSEKGWGLGLHRYEIATPAPWMDGADRIAIPVSHQDQVMALPPGARAIGGNAFTPNGIVLYDDQPAVSFQCHPEFTPAFASALVDLRRDRLPAGSADALLASLGAPNDRARVGGWLRRFLALEDPSAIFNVDGIEGRSVDVS